MTKDRRVFLINSTTMLTLLGLGFFPASGLGWEVNIGNRVGLRMGRTVEETFAALGVGKPLVDQRVVVQAPDTAENGAYVGIGIESSIPDINAVAFLVDKNPTVLAGYFEIKEFRQA